jgi:hypothetical protein
MKSLTRVAGIVLSMGLVLSVSFCGGGSSPTQPPPHESTWTWVSGAKALYQSGVYGTEGTASPPNLPGSRQFGVSWEDSNEHFWLFGGNGFDSTGTQGDLNDLWKFNGTNWTWVSGSDLVDQPGTHRGFPWALARTPAKGIHFRKQSKGQNFAVHASRFYSQLPRFQRGSLFFIQKGMI